MIVIVSNRNVNPNADDHRVFGDKPNAKGLNEPVSYTHLTLPTIYSV